LQNRDCDFRLRFAINNYLLKLSLAVVVTQSAERSILTLEDPGSNPVICNFIKHFIRCKLYKKANSIAKTVAYLQILTGLS